MRKAKNYIGTTIGKFIILDQKSENYIVYLYCKCVKCGRKKWIKQGHVKETKCCDAKSSDTQFKPTMDYHGKTFNDIKILEKTYKKNKSGQTLWKCQCYCGNIFYTLPFKLKNGQVKSCGCYKNPAPSEKTKEKAITAYSEKYLKDNTNLSVISKTAPLSNNKSSGVRGVTYDKSRKRWVAHLDFKGRHYRKRFIEKEDAIKCRQIWEDEFFKPILDKYNKNGLN